MSFQHADDLFRTFFGGSDPFAVFYDKDDDDGPGALFRGIKRQRVSGGSKGGFCIFKVEILKILKK